MIAIAWIIFVAVIFVVLLFSLLIVKYYSDKKEAQLGTTVVAVVGLSLTLLCVLLIPVDIYNASSSSDSHGKALLTPEQIQQRGEAIKIVYYVLYGCILVFAFAVIPFSYFYFEEDDEKVTCCQRVWAGCKYTIFLIVIVVILLVVGLVLFFVKPGDKPAKGQNAEEWIKSLVDNTNFAESAIAFSISILTLLGFLIWITYMAYGLSAFPIGVIKGRKHLAEDASALNSDLEQTRSKMNGIRSKYLSGSKKINKKDEETLGLLQRKERALNRQTDRLTATHKGGWRYVWAIVRPFMFLFGFLFFAVSLLIVASMALTNTDKAINSHHWCGASCGFILAYPQILNPLDSLLTILSKYFPLDYVIISLLVLYMFFSTMSGIVNIGIRFLWVNLFTVKQSSTPPQGMLLATVILMLSVVTLNTEVMTLAPRYSQFGSQVYFNETTNSTIQCSLNAPPGNCTLTQIATFVNTVSLRMSFFGVIFFYATWVFIACYLIGGVIACIRGKRSNIEKIENDSDEDE